MTKFLKEHSEEIVGTLTCPDRLIFKGYLPFYDGKSMERFCYSKDLLFKDMKPFLIKQSEIIKNHAKGMAEKQGRPYIYLNGGKLRKDEEATRIAKEDNITEGLICVFARLEPSRTFKLKYGKKKPSIEKHFGKCLCLYYYFMDKEFGLMHVRIPTWFPLDIQVYVNGHEWLSRQMDKRNISYKQSGNAFFQIDNWKKAQSLSNQLVKRNFRSFLEGYAKKVNPLLRHLLQPMSYYWVTAQAEFATDVIFKDQSSFQCLYERLVHHSMTSIKSTDVMRFLEKKVHGNFKGDISSRCDKLKVKRVEGIRVKHESRKNKIKMYSKLSNCLRVETVINNPYEFKVSYKKKGEVEFKKMKKSVTNLYKYEQVARCANFRYLDHLSQVENPKDGLKALDELTKRKKKNGRSIKPFSPLSKKDNVVLASITRGEFALNGFKNSDIKESLKGTGYFRSTQNEKQKTASVSRLLSRLRSYGLIKRIPRTMRWQLSKKGLSPTN